MNIVKFNWKLTKTKLIDFCKANKIGGRTLIKKKKQELEEIMKTYLLQTISEKSLSDHDPITLDPYSEWTIHELETAVSLNDFYYKEETIRKYIEVNSWKTEIMDPIHQSQKLSSDLIKKYNQTEKKSEFKLQKKNTKCPSLIKFKLKINLVYDVVSSQNKTFYILILKIFPLPTSSCTTNIISSSSCKFSFDYKISKKNYFALGCIPEIDLENSLDTKSTTFSIIQRISDLYRKEDYLIKQMKNKSSSFSISRIKSLPRSCRDWIDTTGNLKIKGQENNPYFLLLNELDNLEYEI